MDLNERRKMILRAIVDDYIRIAEPIGSAYVLNNHDLGISSATIRNEMALLEESGYLDKPHTSAGRVPSSLGYRFYVDELMQQYTLTVNEIASMENALKKRYTELTNIVKDISNTVSYLTNYTALVSTPIVKSSIINNVRFVLIDPLSIVMIIIANDGTVKNTVIHTRTEMNCAFAEGLSTYFNSFLSGMEFSDITEEFINEQKKNIPLGMEITEPIFDFICQTAKTMVNFDVINAGLSNILNYPEFNSIEKTKNFFSFVKNIDKDFFTKELNLNDDRIKILIGDEEPVLKDLGLSMVISNYDLGGGVKGGIAIIGPTRMDYSKVVATLDYIRKNTNKYLN